MPIQVSVNQSPISVSVTPQLGNTVISSSQHSNNITVGNAVSSIDLSNYATIPYVENTSGNLQDQISNISGGSAGVISLNSLSGSINLFSSSDDISFSNSGQFINLNKKPQNLIFYRNLAGSITGVQKNTEFVRIYKNSNDKITGIYYNNYYKKVLLDNNDNITGVNVIYN